MSGHDAPTDERAQSRSESQAGRLIWRPSGATPARRRTSAKPGTHQAISRSCSPSGQKDSLASEITECFYVANPIVGASQVVR